MVHLSRHFETCYSTPSSIDLMYFSIPCDSFFFSLFIVLKRFRLSHSHYRLCLKQWQSSFFLLFFVVVVAVVDFQISIFFVCLYLFIHFLFKSKEIYFNFRVGLFSLRLFFFWGETYTLCVWHEYKKPVWVKNGRENQWTMRIKSVFNYFNLLLASCSENKNSNVIAAVDLFRFSMRIYLNRCGCFLTFIFRA